MLDTPEPPPQFQEKTASLFLTIWLQLLRMRLMKLPDLQFCEWTNSIHSRASGFPRYQKGSLILSWMSIARSERFLGPTAFPQPLTSCTNQISPTGFGSDELRGLNKFCRGLESKKSHGCTSHGLPFLGQEIKRSTSNKRRFETEPSADLSRKQKHVHFCGAHTAHCICIHDI